jgi:hypothetical protein
VCSLHHAQGDEERGFLGLPSKPRTTISPSLASKPLATVLMLWSQNHSLGFPGLGLKIDNCGLVISWFEPQNQVDYNLSVAPQNRWEDEDDVGHASRSSGLLHLEASRG